MTKATIEALREALTREARHLREFWADDNGTSLQLRAADLMEQAADALTQAPEPTPVKTGANGQQVETLHIDGRLIEVDVEIAPIVKALNAAGVGTRASCSGHGHRPANIALRDGREIIIARDYAEARRIESLFPIDINGNAVAPEPSETRECVCEKCGAEHPVWSAASPIWNAVARGGSIDGYEQYAFLCANCFMAMAEDQGIASLFRVTAERTGDLETTTPSGRVWSDTQFKWTEPSEVERVAKAICEADGQMWRTGTYEVASGKNFEIEEHALDPFNNHWRHKARAAIAALSSISKGEA